METRHIDSLDKNLIERWQIRRGVRWLPELNEGGWAIAYLQGNFTYLVLFGSKHIRFSMGMAKRNPRDVPNEQVGINVATWRALDNWLEEQLNGS